MGNYILVVANAKMKKESQGTKQSTRFSGSRKVETKMNMKT